MMTHNLNIKSLLLAPAAPVLVSVASAGGRSDRYGVRLEGLSQQPG